MQTPDLSPDFETRCRERVNADPADATARLELAQSLFLRAFHCVSKAELGLPCPARRAPERALLKESLLQAAVASLLCAGESERKEAKGIADKAREWGAGDLADEAERETQTMQRHLTAALNRH